MSEPRFVVLWEDSLVRGTKPRGYGPHGLAVASVADGLVGEGEDVATRWYELRERASQLIESNPRNGVDKLVAELANPVLYRGGRRVVAVVDADRIGERLRGTGPPDEQIRQRSAQPDQTEAFLIEKNLESLLLRIHAQGGAIGVDELAQARAKDLGMRDRILQRFAADHMSCELRRRVCRTAPGWSGWPALVAWLTSHVTTILAAEATPDSF